MRIQAIAPATLGLVALVAIASPGCSSGGDTQGRAGATTTSTAGSGAGGGGAGGEGAGGEGAGGEGAGAPEKGRSATETVSAGETSASPNYTMVFTFGQPTQNQGKTTSPSYRLQGGLSGANGGVPQ